MTKDSSSLQSALRARAWMCNTAARVHPDPQAQHDSQIRADTYINAMNIVALDDELQQLYKLFDACLFVNDHFGFDDSSQKIKDVLDELTKGWEFKPRDRMR